MSNSVLKLSDPEACDGAVAGGKAASLARMTLAGFSVPRGFVVTTAVYTNSISEIAGQIRSMLAELSSEDFQAITQVSETVRKLLEDIVIPATITEELRNAHVDLHASSVSARSSGTDEDQAKVSFAGQYETYLNILTFDQLIERIRRVWSSAYSPQAIAYRLRNRLPHGDVQMAVVVQEQLAPDAAGVMFTMSPVTRSSDFVVNAGFGLGEGVVAGTVETDHFTLDPNTGTVISSHIVPKSTMIGATPGVASATSTCPKSARSYPH